MLSPRLQYYQSNSLPSLLILFSGFGLCRKLVHTKTQQVTNKAGRHNQRTVFPQDLVFRMYQQKWHQLHFILYPLFILIPHHFSTFPFILHLRQSTLPPFFIVCIFCQVEHHRKFLIPPYYPFFPTFSLSTIFTLVNPWNLFRPPSHSSARHLPVNICTNSRGGNWHKIIRVPVPLTIIRWHRTRTTAPEILPPPPIFI